MNINLGKIELIHFVGIGGIGMSGLAMIMRGLGFKIQGSDISHNKNIERLKKKKIKIFYGHSKKNINKSTIIIISSAIKKNNPEYREAKIQNLPVIKRGEMLGHIVALMKNIVVAGSHGKTTTTSLISAIFSETNLDPTVINGGVLNSFSNSARLGKSDWCILESDESDGSFLNLPSTYSIITNIDNEHLDFYGSFQSLEDYFIKFIKKTPSFGKCFICADDKNNKKIIQKIDNKNFLTYGFDKKSNFMLSNISQDADVSSFDLIIKLPNKKQKKLTNVSVPLFGLHNLLNTAAAVAVAFYIGIPYLKIQKGLKSFKGVERRFNKILKFRNSLIFDDYAHHPTEIKNVLNGVKKVYFNKKIICIFQPHRISRFNSLYEDFSKSFKNSDMVILCPIYKAGEKIELKIKYKEFMKSLIKNSKIQVILINHQNELNKLINQIIFEESIIIGMGAGSVSTWIRELPHNLNEN